MLEVEWWGSHVSLEVTGHNQGHIMKYGKKIAT
jgi:hypothetical protein